MNKIGALIYRSLIYRSLISAIIILGLSYLFIQQGFNLLGIGYSWIIGQAVTSVIYLFRGK